MFEIAQTGTAEIIVLMLRQCQERVPEAFGPRLLQFLQDRNDLPAIAGVVLLVDLHGRADVFIHQRSHALEPPLCFSDFFEIMHTP